MRNLHYVVLVKSTVEISQNFVAFSEYMNFNKTQNQRGREANDCVVPLTRYHFSFLTSIPFPSILLVSKGQLISECLLGVIDFQKNQRKI